MIIAICAILASQAACASKAETTHTSFNYTVGTLFALTYVETPSNGYLWKVDIPDCIKEVNSTVIRSEAELNSLRNNMPIMGAPHQRRVIYNCTAVCEEDMLLHRTAPGARDTPVASHTYRINVKAADEGTPKSIP